MAQLATINVNGEPRVFSGDGAVLFRDISGTFSTAIIGNKAILFNQGFGNLPAQPLATLTQVGSDAPFSAPTAVANSNQDSTVNAVANSNGGNANANAINNASGNGDSTVTNNSGNNNSGNTQQGSGNVVQQGSNNGGAASQPATVVAPAPQVLAPAPAAATTAAVTIAAPSVAAPTQTTEVTQVVTLSTVRSVHITTSISSTTAQETSAGGAAAATTGLASADMAANVATSSNSLSASTKAGLGIGIAAMVLLLAVFGAWLWLTHRRRRQDGKSSFKVGSVTRISSPETRMYEAELATEVGPGGWGDARPGGGRPRWSRWFDLHEKQAEVPVAEKG